MSNQVLSIEDQERLFERFKRVAKTVTNQTKSLALPRKTKGRLFDNDADCASGEKGLSTTGICHDGESEGDYINQVVVSDDDGIKYHALNWDSDSQYYDANYRENFCSNIVYDREKGGPLTQALASKLIADFARAISRVAPREYTFERVTTLICGTALSEHEHAVMTPFDKADALVQRLDTFA